MRIYDLPAGRVVKGRGSSVDNSAARECYCQPAGGSPQNNVNATSASDFCVGQFLLAATQMHLLVVSDKIYKAIV